jgi:predicted metal-dependent HD superfamily phosphohydrolase
LLPATIFEQGGGIGGTGRAGENSLVTAAHAASPDDPAAWVLLDADLAILGADPPGYDRYRLAVRWEARARANIVRELESLTGAAPRASQHA